MLPIIVVDFQNILQIRPLCLRWPMIQVRLNVKSSLPLKFETNSFTCLPKHDCGQNKLVKNKLILRPGNQTRAFWLVSRCLTHQLWPLRKVSSKSEQG